MKTEPRKTDQYLKTVAQYTARLSVCEISLGSLLHGLRIPGGGHFMSLNQIFFMTICLKSTQESEKSRLAPAYMSQISSVLKCMSPAGKRLGPMISISLQGLLYYFGILIFGINPIGLFVAGGLSSIWAFIQPIVTMLILFGGLIVDSIESMAETLVSSFGINTESLLLGIVILILIKFVFAGVLSVFAYRLETSSSNRYINFLLGKLPPSRPRKKELTMGKQFIKDITHPLFAVSLFLSFFYLVANKTSMAEIFLALARPVSILWLFLVISRLNLVDRLLKKYPNSFLSELVQETQYQIGKLL